MIPNPPPLLTSAEHEKVLCRACNSNRFRVQYIEARPAHFFGLIKAKPARVSCECSRCGCDHSFEPGTIQAHD